MKFTMEHNRVVIAGTREHSRVLDWSNKASSLYCRVIKKCLNWRLLTGSGKIRLADWKSKMTDRGKAIAQTWQSRQLINLVRRGIVNKSSDLSCSEFQKQKKQQKQQLSSKFLLNLKKSAYFCLQEAPQRVWVNLSPLPTFLGDLPQNFEPLTNSHKNWIHLETSTFSSRHLRLRDFTHPS